MLDSFVPEIPGAMCIYGVTRVMPAATALIQAATPAVIFILGAWLLLERMRRQSGLPARRSRGMLALALAAGLVAFAHGAEVYYVCNMTSLHEVSCCSGRGERGGVQLQAPAYYLPWEFASPACRVLLNTLFFAGVPSLALWLLAQSRRGPDADRERLSEMLPSPFGRGAGGEGGRETGQARSIVPSPNALTLTLSGHRPEVGRARGPVALLFGQPLRPLSGQSPWRCWPLRLV